VCYFAWNVTFPLLKFYDTDDDGNPSFWIRDGQKIRYPKTAPAENPEAATGMIGGEVTYDVLRQGLKELRQREDAKRTPPRT